MYTVATWLIQEHENGAMLTGKALVPVLVHLRCPQGITIMQIGGLKRRRRGVDAILLAVGANKARPYTANIWTIPPLPLCGIVSM